MRRQINGTVFYPMSQRLQDTREALGIGETWKYFVITNKMPEWQFWILLGYPASLTG